jgi:hypothetical protein
VTELSKARLKQPHKEGTFEQAIAAHNQVDEVLRHGIAARMAHSIGIKHGPGAQKAAEKSRCNPADLVWVKASAASVSVCVLLLRDPTRAVLCCWVFCFGVPDGHAVLRCDLLLVLCSF